MMIFLFPVLLFLSTTLLLSSIVVEAGRIVTYNSNEHALYQQDGSANKVEAVSFVSRIVLPYGPDTLKKGETENDDDNPVRLPYSGYGYGNGAADAVVYDRKHHYFYALSGLGYMTVTDFIDPHNPVLTDIALNMNEWGDPEKIDVCTEHDLLFIGIAAPDGQAKLVVFGSTRRDNPSKPVALHEINLVSMADVILVNDDCSVVATIHANPGNGIVAGSITLIKGLNMLRQIQQEQQQHLDELLDVDNIPFDDLGWDDHYILSKGMNMPLTKNALEYWDDHSHLADRLDFSATRANYRPSIFMSPESLTWMGPDQTQLLINMQPNNGILRMDVGSKRVLDIAGYGMKNHEQVPIDINAHDNACHLETYEKLFATRGPDAIAAVQYNGKSYLIVASEGDITEYENWIEGIVAKDIFNGTSFGLKNMEVPKSLYDPENPTAGASALFNAMCEGPKCVNDVLLGLGSNAVDYESDPTNPIFHRMVLHGGRGWSIYEVPEDPSALLKLVYDSADTVERGGCEKFPWAHNAFHDETSAPALNLPNNSYYLLNVQDDEIREKLEAMNDPTRLGCPDQGDGEPGACPLGKWVDHDSSVSGASVESVAIGVACGRLHTAVVTELSSVAILYDITEINAPSIVEIFHLSPASETKSPGVSYNDGTIGDVVTRNIVFLSEEESPTGKAALMFSGQESGTLSFYEIECVEEISTSNKGGVDENNAANPSSAPPRQTAVAGILLVGSLLLGFVGHRLMYY